MNKNVGRNIVIGVLILVVVIVLVAVFLAKSFESVTTKIVNAITTPITSPIPKVAVVTETPPPPVLVYVTQAAPAATELPPSPSPVPPTSAPVEVNQSTSLFLSPVVVTDFFNQESKWLIAEPGIILDDTAAWTIPGTKDTWYINVPEGGFTYFSMGQGVIDVASIKIDMPWIAGNNYLVGIRGSIDDTIFSNDLNKTAAISGFVPGHAIWSIMKPGAYISKDWFYDQMVVSTTTGGTNCGATGCNQITIILADVDSGLVQRFVVKADNLNNWTQIQ
jgi:hypothetical protein